MRFVICRLVIRSAIAIAILATATASQAHFLWLKTVTVDGKPNALLFFNESPADETYHFPDKLAKTKVRHLGQDQKQADVKLKGVDTDDRVGLIGPLPDAKPAVLDATQQYGIYGTALLVYHAKNLTAKSPSDINSINTAKDEEFEIIPRIEGNELTLLVLWKGSPLKGSDVSIFQGKADPVEKKTDDKGHATIELEKGGLVGVLANTMEDDKTGELGGKPYKGVMHYASLTLDLPEKLGESEHKSSKAKKVPSVEAEASEFASLPEPLASFGGVVSDGWLYVYGGHTGEEHHHSAENLSNHFRRIKLDGGKNWEELEMQTPLQGLPLIAHGGKLYRVGGLAFRNATAKDKEDDHSCAEFAEYDPASNKWTALAPLPAARSSHNAVVIGDRLYVVGGWDLDGKPPGTWKADALFYDFANPDKGWQKLAQPEFKRRALALGQWNGKLVAMGGMNEKADVAMDVFIYDPATDKWAPGPVLPGAGMAGFGVSAWNLNGGLYECGVRGVLYKLDGAGTAWEEAGHVKTPRFFHQLLPGPNGGLIVVGGAAMSGHIASIERVEIEAQKGSGAKL